MFAKASVLIRVGGRLGGIIAAVCLAHDGISVASGRMPAIPAGVYAVLVLSHAGLAAVALPVAVSFGLIVMLFYLKRGKWLIIPYLVLVQIPSVTFGLIAGVNESNMHYISSPRVWIYILGVVAAGWPLAYSLLRVTAKYGLKNVPNLPSPGKFASGHAPARHRGAIPAGGGIKSLYLFERMRYIYYGS